MRTIAVINQKGGCGKTTVAINLAGALNELDRRVLIVDMDPQAHATLGLGVDGGFRRLTAYELLRDPTVTVTDAICRVTDRLFVVPANTVLSGVEQQMADEMGREEHLARKIGGLAPDAFDFVIVDCPPSVGLLTFNALVAVDEVIIPVDASYFSLHGLAKLRETIEVIEHELEHPLQVHVVCNNLDTRTHFSNELLDEVEKFHEGVLLDAYITHSVRLKEAARRGVTVFDIERTSKPARQFLSLARELAGKTVAMAARTYDVPAMAAGPHRVDTGVQFCIQAPRAAEVMVTGEFNNWARDGVRLRRDPSDGLWKATVDIPPGEYEYRFVIDGVWMRDPSNRDYIRNEFGQENSVLIV